MTQNHTTDRVEIAFASAEWHPLATTLVEGDGMLITV